MKTEPNFHRLWGKTLFFFPEKTNSGEELMKLIIKLIKISN